MFKKLTHLMSACRTDTPFASFADQTVFPCSKLAIFLLIMFSTSVLGSEISSIYKMPAFVQEVKMIGTWAYPGKGHGQARLSITKQKDASKVFIQWLTHESSNKPAKVLSTIAVKEINEYGRYEVMAHKGSLEDGNRVILVKLTDKHNRQLKYGKIVLKGVGKYSCIITNELELPSDGPL